MTKRIWCRLGLPPRGGERRRPGTRIDQAIVRHIGLLASLAAGASCGACRRRKQDRADPTGAPADWQVVSRLAMITAWTTPRGERFGPESISEVAPSALRSRLARIFFSTAVFCATYIIVWMTSSPPRSDLPCLVVAIIVGTVAGWRSNGRSLLWLWAETLGRPRAAETVLGVRPSDLPAYQMKRVPASALEPGDWPDLGRGRRPGTHCHIDALGVCNGRQDKRATR
jgi:hypothetical protein